MPTTTPLLTLYVEDEQEARVLLAALDEYGEKYRGLASQLMEIRERENMGIAGLVNFVGDMADVASRMAERVERDALVCGVAL